MQCNCGSGLDKYPLYDARGIFCTYVRDECKKEKMKEFRSEVFTDSNYEHDEPIEGDEMDTLLWRSD